MDKLLAMSTLTGTLIGFLFGSWTILMNVLLVLIALDLLSGFLKGVVQRKLRSRVMLDGGIRKLSIFIVVIVANMMDIALFGGMPIVKGAAISYYIAMEGLSILENVGSIGLPLPPLVRESLEVLRNKGMKVKGVEIIKVVVDEEKKAEEKAQVEKDDKS